MKHTFSRSRHKNSSQLNLFPFNNTGTYVSGAPPKVDKLLVISGTHSVVCTQGAEKTDTTVHIAEMRTEPGSVRIVDFGDNRAAKRKNKRQELSEKFLAYAEKIIW